jgi:hypothetical protein
LGKTQAVHLSNGKRLQAGSIECGPADKESIGESVAARKHFFAKNSPRFAKGADADPNSVLHAPNLPRVLQNS